MRAFIQGELTLADLYELTHEELYGLAAQGRRLHENGKFEAAQQIFEGLPTLAPNEASFHTGLGAVYQRLEQLERACEEYDRALSLNERDLAALCNRAEVRLQQGKSKRPRGISSASPSWTPRASRASASGREAWRWR